MNGNSIITTIIHTNQKKNPDAFRRSLIANMIAQDQYHQQSTTEKIKINFYEKQ